MLLNEFSFFKKELDTEYRYWSFIDAHPAQNSLPVKAKIEEMDVLTWAWTGKLIFSHPLARPLRSSFLISLERLLSSHRAAQEERQELMTLTILWRYLPDISFFQLQIILIYIYETTDDHDDHGIHALFPGFSSELLSLTFTYFLSRLG